MSAHEAIRKDSTTYAALHKQVQATSRLSNKSKHDLWCWRQAVQQMRAFDAPMFALFTEEGEARIRASDPALVELAICYLEVDPRHFRSGYNKARLIRRLKHLTLAPGQEERLRVVVLQVLDGPARPEFREFWRLAARMQSAGLEQRIAERLASPEPRIQQRARQFLDFLAHHRRSEKMPDSRPPHPLP